ncbi:NAD(P)H-dependent oxidoreductase [Tepidibacillus marianensis]|uniref:flavodoxin family protein n=1 Tax=Tepidibacillus marianensis TaxID=3131995 RepID=UPI0030D2767D
MKLLTIYGSSRKNGNSEVLTKKVLEQLDPEHVHEIHLLDYHVEPIIDKRHSEDGFQPVQDNYEEIAHLLMNHEAILFATPLYWYGMSGQMKNVFDRFTQSLRSTEYDFKTVMKEKKSILSLLVEPRLLSPLSHSFSNSN